MQQYVTNTWLKSPHSGPIHSQIHLVVIFPIPECLSRIDTLSNWQNPHSGSLTHGMQTLMVGKTKWKPLELYLPRKSLNQKKYCILGRTVQISAP